MSYDVRRDNKGRKLLNGESQRKDGMYEYKYLDNAGKRKSVYSWKLTASDPLPPGRKACVPLREKEKQIQKDLYEGIRYEGGDITVLELVKKYVDQKRGVRHNTKANYNFVINIIAKEEFGQKRIDKVKLSDAKAWLIKLQDDGRGYSTIHTVRGVVRPAFQMAVDDDLIRKNPFEFQLNTVVVNDSVTREAISSRPKPKVEPMIDGRCGFLFLDKNEMLMVALHWEKYFQHVVEKYNRIYRVQLPKITPHVCRHTYCSNMAKAGMNPKTLQYLMGHSDIGVTLNTYTHFKFEDAQAEVLLMDESCRKKSSYVS